MKFVSTSNLGRLRITIVSLSVACVWAFFIWGTVHFIGLFTHLPGPVLAFAFVVALIPLGFALFMLIPGFLTGLFVSTISAIFSPSDTQRRDE